MEKDQQRKLQREHLVTARAELSGRAEREQTLHQHVAEWLSQADVRAVGFYWPIRGEPDLRSVIADWLDADERRVAACRS